jgi:hypothetical protein
VECGASAAAWNVAVCGVCGAGRSTGALEAAEDVEGLDSEVLAGADACCGRATVTDFSEEEDSGDTASKAGASAAVIVGILLFPP